jgi:Zn finger protein HypA/HybF involved in hydrogenase expression
MTKVQVRCWHCQKVLCCIQRPEQSITQEILPSAVIVEIICPRCGYATNDIIKYIDVKC